MILRACAVLAVLVPLSANAAERVVNLAAEEMRFTPSAITVKAGETIRFEIANRGQIVHEFAVGTPDEHATHRKMMAEMAGSHDHGHHHGMHGDGEHHPAKVVMIEPGRTAVLKARFAKAGRLEFACNIPGHYEAGMAGALTIQPKEKKQ